jgi:hypothetical protein
MKSYRHLVYKPVLSTLMLGGLLVVFWGCAGTAPVTRGDNGGPKQHLWQPLTRMSSEEKGFGMYTYVLFGRKLKPIARLERETLDRYESLLNAIHVSTLSTAEGGDFDKAETNVFLIPVKAEVTEPTRYNYNDILSLRCIALSSAMVRDVAPTLSDRLATGEGPFLISTQEPLGEMKKERVVLLYADLSTTNSAAMAEIVGAYKRRIGKGIHSIERFRSLRLALLDFILDADDNIKIVKTALAQD